VRGKLYDFPHPPLPPGKKKKKKIKKEGKVIDQNEISRRVERFCSLNATPAGP